MDLVYDLQNAIAGHFGDRLQIEVLDSTKRGSHLDITASGCDIEPMATMMDGLGYALEGISGVDWPADGVMEVVYDFNKMTADGRITVRVQIPREKPELPSICHIFGGANWHEREAHDMFGIMFSGHPNLTPLLLPEDATFHPLRKDFAP
jgi:NADH-quinone oxidoreductase subunit C